MEATEALMPELTRMLTEIKDPIVRDAIEELRRLVDMADDLAAQNFQIVADDAESLRKRITVLEKQISDLNLKLDTMRGACGP